MRPHAVRLATLALASVLACAATRDERVYAASLPPEVRPSFELFAQRCSKCHALSRPLDSGIDDDAYWGIYVRRMRLQPGSGISAADEAVILSFLRYYAKERRERRSPRPAGSAAAPPPLDAAVEPPSHLEGGIP